MKRMFACLTAMAVLAAGAAPAAKKAVVPQDPNAFASYAMGNKATWDHPSAALWQNEPANQAAVEALTAPDVLKAIVADERTATRLLAAVKPAYGTDPLIATQIAAVTQFVMQPEDGWFSRLCFWSRDRHDARVVWTKALLQTIRTAKDDEVAIFCLEQFRWCGFPCQAVSVKTVTANRHATVKAMAQLVARELAP